jgi:hypothetical protein
MQAAELLVFNDIIYSGAIAYTSATFNDALASQDRLAIVAVVDNVSAISSFDLYIEHSCDGRNWILRNETSQAFPVTYLSSTGDIFIGGMGVNTTYAKMYSDSALAVNKAVSPVGYSFQGGPLLGHVRFAMKVSSGFAHVKVYATLRGLASHANTRSPARQSRAPRRGA